MGELPLALIPEHHLDIIVWIAPFVATDAVPDLKESNLLGGAVNQLMRNALGSPQHEPQSVPAFLCRSSRMVNIYG